MFCKKCGKDLGDHPGRYCPGCGSPVEEKKPKSKKIWIPVVAAVALFGVAAGVFVSGNKGLGPTVLKTAKETQAEQQAGEKQEKEAAAKENTEETAREAAADAAEGAAKEAAGQPSKSATGQKTAASAGKDLAEKTRRENGAWNKLISVEFEDNLYELDLNTREAKLVYAEKPVIHPSVDYEGGKYPVTEIEDHGMEFIIMNPISGVLNPNGIKGTIEIPDTVKRIGDSAFANQIGLERIEIPESVKEIGAGAFMGCSRLNEVEIPDTVEKIGGGAFLDTQWANENQEEIFVWKGTLVQCLGGFQETEYVIPPEVTAIGEDAFGGQGLQAVTVPDHVKRIGARAFAGCADLAEIEISDQVGEIGGQAFALTAWAEAQSSAEFLWKDQFVQLNHYPDLSSQAGQYRIPDGTKRISDYAFASLERYGMRATLIDHLEMPDGVSEIGKGAFQGCGTYVYIPSSVKKIGDYAFFRSYQSIRHGPMMTGKYGVVIPEGVETIGKRAFGENYYIGSITLPSTLKEVSQDAFSWYPDWDGYSWALRSRHYILSDSGSEVEFATDDYEIFKEQVFKTYLGKFPNTMEILVPEDRKQEYEDFFSGRSEFDVELLIQGNKTVK